jgi:CubicO group peptidase (beta-lactamase class C family)
MPPMKSSALSWVRADRLLALAAAAGLLSACATTRQVRASPPETFAWASFDSRAITKSGASGLADRAAGRRLTITDPVRIASISKLIVALGVMRLVENGKLDLDRDVSEILGWPLRNPAFPDKPITLRLLLSHRSSLRDGIDYALPLGTVLRTSLGAPEAFDLEHAPGTYFRYTNLNFPVVATVMEAATGERFDRLIDRLVLKPLKLQACFNWMTCSDDAIAHAVVLYAADGKVERDDLKHHRPDCPVVPAADGGCDVAGYRLASNGATFSPQGGLRISVADLAKVGQLLLRRGRLADGSAFLSEASFAAMTSPTWRFDGLNGETESGFYCGYGLAVQILAQCSPTDDPFADSRLRYGHAGDAYGLRSGLWVDPQRGTGTAYFATSLGEDPPRGRSSYRQAEEWLAERARP